MKFITIALETDQRGVATLTLNQPDKHNAMSSMMISELSAATQALNDDKSVRVVVLTGRGKSFCAGGDLDWMKSQFEADRSTRISEAMKLASMLHGLNELHKPLIGRINGAAYGGGIGMISVCDVAIGVCEARFALTETRLGLIPATISPYVLARMGEGNARQVFMSGKRFDGNRAVSLGLLADCVPAERLDDAVEAEIDPFVSTAPGAVAKAKKLTRMLGPVIDEALMLKTANLLADCWESEETIEGITAFLDKTKPSWQT